MRLRHIKGAEELVKRGKYYVDVPYSYCGKWCDIFGNDNPIYIEIGMGKGDFIIENAIRYPDINFVGIEKYDSVILKAIEKSDKLDLSNLRLIRMDALNINKVFDREISNIYLNFSDPWPKDRHAKRRLTSSVFLKLYDNIFVSDMQIIMKTDNLSLFDYSLESLKEYGYDLVYINRDLHKFCDENNIMTEYERKFSSKGIKINKFVATKKKK